LGDQAKKRCYKLQRYLSGESTYHSITSLKIWKCCLIQLFHDYNQCSLPHWMGHKKTKIIFYLMMTKLSHLTKFLIEVTLFLILLREACSPNKIIVGNIHLLILLSEAWSSNKIIEHPSFWFLGWVFLVQWFDLKKKNLSFRGFIH